MNDWDMVVEEASKLIGKYEFPSDPAGQFEEINGEGEIFTLDFSYYHPDFTTLTDNQPDSLKIFSMMEIIVLIVILSKILILPWMKMVIICLMMRGISY